MMRLKGLICCLALVIFSGVLLADTGSAEKRAKIQKMRSEVLTRLYSEESSARGEVKEAAGYGVFSNIGVNVILFSAGGGQGVVRDNRSGKDIYMNMASAGFGIGMGVKDFRAVFIFHSRKALQNFIEYGWDFSGQTDVAVKSGEKGVEDSRAGSIVDGVTVYQLTENGLALQATLQGTKYWKSKELN